MLNSIEKSKQTITANQIRAEATDEQLDNVVSVRVCICVRVCLYVCITLVARKLIREMRTLNPTLYTP